MTPSAWSTGLWVNERWTLLGDVSYFKNKKGYQSWYLVDSSFNPRLQYLILYIQLGFNPWLQYSILQTVLQEISTKFLDVISLDKMKGENCSLIDNCPTLVWGFCRAYQGQWQWQWQCSSLHTATHAHVSLCAMIQLLSFLLPLLRHLLDKASVQSASVSQ